jgi:hypothetical protein
MTACVLIFLDVDPTTPNGQQVPILIADTLASFDGGPGSRAILPSNTSREVVRAPRTVAMVRKLEIFGDAAVAFAGDATLIQGAMHELRNGLPPDERPSLWLSKEITRINRAGYGDGMSAICAYIDAEVGPMAARCVAPATSPLEYSENVGHRTAIGSGAPEIIGMVESLVRTSERPWTLGQIFGSLNGHRLATEMMGEAKNSWGGYTEFVYWNSEKWLRGPPTLHLFATFIPFEDGFTTIMMTRYIAYDPAGRIFSVSQAQTGAHVHEFRLEEIASIEDSPIVPFGEFWNGWKPQIIVLTLFGNTRPDIIQMKSYYMGSDDASDVSVEFTREQASVEVSGDLFSRISEKTLSSMGLKYVPSTAVPKSGVSVIDFPAEKTREMFARKRH